MRDDVDIEIVLGVVSLAKTLDLSPDNILFILAGNDDSITTFLFRIGVSLFMAKPAEPKRMK